MALLDSGSSDFYASKDLVQELELVQHLLKQPLSVRVVTGEYITVTRFVRLKVRLGQMAVRLLLKVIKTPISVLLWYNWLAGAGPQVDWKKGLPSLERRGRTVVIQLYPYSGD